jgi:hypothetical protein
MAMPSNRPIRAVTAVDLRVLLNFGHQRGRSVLVFMRHQGSSSYPLVSVGGPLLTRWPAVEKSHLPEELVPSATTAKGITF